MPEEDLLADINLFCRATGSIALEDMVGGVLKLRKLSGSRRGIGGQYIKMVSCRCQEYANIDG